MQLTLALLLVVIILGGLFFWTWSRVPQSRVPPHLTGDDLKRLKTEDRLRQTHYELLAGGALVLTFCMTVIQAATNYNQWKADHDIRLRQAGINQRSEALKALSAGTDALVRGPAYFQLKQLADNYPEEGDLVLGVLVNAVQVLTTRSQAPEKLSIECNGEGAEIRDREPASLEVQLSMKIVGHSGMARLRNSEFMGSACRNKRGSTPFTEVILSHLRLDNLELGSVDLSCTDLSQSSFRRVSFARADLRGTDFSGSSFDDWRNIGFSDHLAAANVSSTGGAKWLHDSEQSWRRDRCWIANFRGADLTGASFEGAGLAGVDFAGARLAGTRFERANVSRANFRQTNVTQAQLSAACADDPPLFDSSNPISVPPCR